MWKIITRVLVMMQICYLLGLIGALGLKSRNGSTFRESPGRGRLGSPLDVLDLARLYS